MERLASGRDALRAAGLGANALPPAVALLAMTGLSQVLVLEQALGITTGHAETFAFVERQLAELTAGASRETRA